MNSWFTVKVKYTKQLENGTFKRVSEPYLLAAMTFTDAEARIYEELGTTIRGEFLVTGIARTDIHDIFQYDESDTWFKAKISYDKLEEEGDKKKTISQNFLVSAETVKEAYERIEESLSTLMIDYQITQIIASPIVDIFPYNDSEVESPVAKRVMPEIEHEPKAAGKVFSASGSDFDDEFEDELAEIENEDETDEFEESEISDEYSNEDEN
ncbi:MAG: DUF4494 domain-containing protein [Flavobacteriales bacterium]|nr:DUF4494 domain-containing protein [Flavobacteriales bacterium]